MYLLSSAEEMIASERVIKAESRIYNSFYSWEQVEFLVKLENESVETLNLVIEAFKYLSFTHPQSEDIGNVGLHITRGWMESEHPHAFFRFKDIKSSKGGTLDIFDTQVVLEVNWEDICLRHENFSLENPIDEKNLIWEELWLSFEYYLKTRSEA
jgi:hypothetical protein